MLRCGILEGLKQMGQRKIYFSSACAVDCGLYAMRFRQAALAVIALGMLVIGMNDATGEEASTTATEDKFNYTVKCEHKGTPQVACQVDNDTHIGWTMFSIDCHQCHGENAEGTSFGPNLVQKLQEGLDFEPFKEVVTHGMRGEMGVMPGWKDNAAVIAKLDALYRFLKARADGALPPGRPELLK